MADGWRVIASQAASRVYESSAGKDLVGKGENIVGSVAFAPFSSQLFGLCSPDKPYNLNSEVLGHCTIYPLVNLSWTYNHRFVIPQYAYRIELDDDPNFDESNDSALWKSCDPDPYCILDGTTVPESFWVSVPTSGIVTYGNKNYYWRVKVFDQNLNPSV